MIKKIVILSIAFLLFDGCTGKQFVEKKNQESAFIKIKAPKMRYAGMGFIYKSSAGVKVEVYSMGQPIVSLDINAQNVCMSLFECMKREDFNAKMLHASYPAPLLEHIFKSQPIFNKEGYEKQKDGFVQTIKKDKDYEITYSVISGKRTFHDTINKITIEVREQ